MKESREDNFKHITGEGKSCDVLLFYVYIYFFLGVPFFFEMEIMMKVYTF